MNAAQNAVIEARPEPQTTAVTPMQMLAHAMERGADLDQLQKLMDLQERYEATQARRQFNEAFAAFKAEAIVIVKSTTIKDGPLAGKKHANLFDVVAAATPKLSAHGLAISWRLTKDEPGWMEVTCTLRHIGGHSESVSMGGAPDTGPGRNAIQARGSTKNYLERYTATAILGLAAKEQDDDGMGGAAASITDKQAADLQALAEEVGANREAFMNYFGIKRLAEMPVGKYAAALAMLQKKRRKA